MLFKRNPLKKFGLKRGQLQDNYIYSTLEFGTTDEMLREAKRLNKVARKLGDRKYFVWPVAGPLGHAVLIVGRKAGMTY